MYQAVLESEGITLTEADAEAAVKEIYGGDDYYDSAVETYGKGYTNKSAVENKAITVSVGGATVK